MIEGLLQDVRNASRRIARAPGFACAVIATLALAIGANTAAFSLVNAIILRTVPVREPDRVVVLQATEERGTANRPIYYSTFSELAKLPIFKTLSLYSGGGVFPIDVRGVRSEGLIEASTPGLLESLGLQPFLGRFFTSTDAPGEGPPAPVVVISHDFWTRTFAADRDAIGETIVIEGVGVTVIGVTPPEYKGFYVDGGFGFSVPLSFLNRHLGTDPKRPVRGLNAVGRLADGVSLEQARAAAAAAWPTLRVDTIPAGLSQAEQKEIPTYRLGVDSLATGFSGLRRQYREPLLLVAAISTVLLLIGCVNLTGLLLARTAARGPQIAIHRALGASGSRIVRQLLIENLILCAAGAGVALLLAWWITLAAGPLLWQSATPLVQSLTPDARVLSMTVLVTIGTAVIITLVPGWTTGRRSADQAMRSSRSVARAGTTWTKALLATQIAMSLVLLVGAGLLGVSLINLQTLDTGVRHDGLRWSRLFAVPNGYRNQTDATYYPELVRQLSDVPGVQSVALAQLFPAFFALDSILTKERVAPLGSTNDSDVAEALMERVSPGFFETAGIALLRGRDFLWQDTTERSPVVIINESLRERLFPDVNPIGQRIRIGAHPTRSAVEVIGIVADAVIGGYRTPHVPVVFRPRMQDVTSARAPVMLFRTSGDPAVVDAGMSKVIAGLGHEYPRRFASLDEQIDSSLLRERLLAILSGFFAGLGVLLSFVGIYSALAFAVSGRTRELGLRMALGATRQSVMRIVIRDSVGVTLVGVAIGIPGTIAASRYVATWFFGVAATDPLMLLGSATFFVAIGIAAAAVPALRASSVDPTTALRAE